MRFSRLRERISIETQSDNVSASGAVTDGWAAHSTVWAERRVLRGNERERIMQLHAEVEEMFTIRYSPEVRDVGPTHRILHGTEYHDIVAVVPVPGNKPVALEIFTKRVAGTESAALGTEGGELLLTEGGEGLLAE